MKPVRFLLIAIVCLIANAPAWAQAPRWQWANAQPFTVRSVATDAQGNAYVVGDFQGTITIGQTQLTSTSLAGPDLVVAKYDQQGRPVWVSSLGARPHSVWYSQSYVRAVNIAVNPRTGEPYVLATLQGLLDESVPGDNYPYELFQTRMLAMKFSAAGQVAWSVQGVGGYFGNQSIEMVVDQQGNSYVTGVAYSMILTTGDWVSSGRNGAYIFSLDNNGGYRWGTGGYSRLGSYCRSMRVDEQNGLYALIDYQVGPYNSLEIGGLTLESPQTWEKRVSLIKFDTQSGNGRWATTTQAGALAVDAQGTSYVVGAYSGAFTLGQFSLPTAPGYNAFLARIGTNGALLGLSTLGATSSTSTLCIAANSASAGGEKAVVALARPAGSTALLGLQADGAISWETEAGGTGGRGVAVAPGAGPHARVLLTGSFTDQARFGSRTVRANGNAAYVASLTFRPTTNKAPEKKAELSLYPNPVRDQFTLRLPAQAGAQLELVNLYGRVVHAQRVEASAAEAELKVNVQRLPRGLYTLRLRAGGQTETRQVQLD